MLWAPLKENLRLKLWILSFRVPFLVFFWMVTLANVETCAPSVKQAANVSDLFPGVQVYCSHHVELDATSVTKGHSIARLMPSTPPSSFCTEVYPLALLVFYYLRGVHKNREQRYSLMLRHRIIRKL